MPLLPKYEKAAYLSTGMKDAWDTYKQLDALERALALASADVELLISYVKAVRSAIALDLSYKATAEILDAVLAQVEGGG